VAEGSVGQTGLWPPLAPCIPAVLLPVAAKKKCFKLLLPLFGEDEQVQGLRFLLLYQRLYPRTVAQKQAVQS